MRAAQQGDLTHIEAAARQIGFFSENILATQKEAVLALFILACEPLRYDGAFDFAQSNLAQRVKDQGIALSFEHDYWHAPPADALFFHRKLGGLYLLAAKLKAKVNLKQLFNDITDNLLKPSYSK